MRSMQRGGFAVAERKHEMAASAAASCRGLLLTGGVLTSLALVGCADVGAQIEACARPATDEPTLYTGGNVEGGVYRTSPWDGELLFFPGGAWYQIEHRLGEVPDWFQFYLSFERDGLGSGSLAQAAGNQVEVKAIDNRTIEVLNGSCVDYWLLGVVGVGGDGPSP
jgi:hypothetical protein